MEIFIVTGACVVSAVAGFIVGVFIFQPTGDIK